VLRRIGVVLLRVVGDVPAGAFELEGGRRQKLADVPAAGRTDLDRRGGEFLDSLEARRAFVALVLVQWHGVLIRSSPRSARRAAAPDGATTAPCRWRAA